MKTKCPFGKLKCEECRLFRQGIRLVGIEQKQEKIEACVFHIIADNIEAEHKSILNLQAETGETKNAAIFQAMAILADSAGAKEELKRLILKRFVEIKKLF